MSVNALVKCENTKYERTKCEIIDLTNDMNSLVLKSDIAAEDYVDLELKEKVERELPWEIATQINGYNEMVELDYEADLIAELPNAMIIFIHWDKLIKCINEHTSTVAVRQRNYDLYEYLLVNYPEANSPVALDILIKRREWKMVLRSIRRGIQPTPLGTSILIYKLNDPMIVDILHRYISGFCLDSIHIDRSYINTHEISKSTIDRMNQWVGAEVF